MRSPSKGYISIAPVPGAKYARPQCPSFVRAPFVSHCSLFSTTTSLSVALPPAPPEYIVRALSFLGHTRSRPDTAFTLPRHFATTGHRISRPMRRLFHNRSTDPWEVVDAKAVDPVSTYTDEEIEGTC